MASATRSTIKLVTQKICMCALWMAHWLADSLNWSNFWFNHSLTTTVNIFFLFVTWKLRNQPHYSNSNRTELGSLVTLGESSAKGREKVLSLVILADIFAWGMASRAKSSEYFSIYLSYILLNWSNAFSNQYSNKSLLQWQFLFAGQFGILSLVFIEYIRQRTLIS